MKKFILRAVLVFLVIIIVFVEKLYRNDYKSWFITQKLKENTLVAQGVLVRHENISHGRGRFLSISVVKFIAEGKAYYAKTDRIKVPIGIEFPVKYNVEDPSWHRVIVHDSLAEYQSSWGFWAEDLHYTWPPTKPDNKRIAKGEDYHSKGPY